MAESDSDALYEQWREQLDVIDNDVTSLFHHRQIWREMRDGIIDAAATASGAFLQSYTKLYVDAQVMTLRRLVDPNRRSISFVRLLEAIARTPDVVSRDRFVANYERNLDDPLDEYWRNEGRKDFDRYAAAGTDHIDPAQVRADRAELIEAVDVVKEWADKVVAHRAPKEELPMTYAHIDEAIEVAGRLLRRYIAILKAADRVELAPIMGPDWKGPFRAPIFKPLVEDF